MGKDVLLIESDPFVQKLLVKLIEAANYTTVIAESGVTALELLETRAFNLITLDLQTPILDGDQFLKKLPLLAPTTPVVVISDDNQEVKPHPQIKAAISKPFHFEHLLTLIACYIA